MITAQPEDKETVINILTAAFLDNKSVNYLIRQDGYKLFRIRALMDYSFEACRQHGKVLLSDDRKACALLIYPELQRTSVWSIWLDLKLVFNGIGFYNALRAMKRRKMITSIHSVERMAYLWFIGVDPRYQHFGLGKRLMEEIIIAALQDNRPIYLETSTLANLPWYKKFGFEVYHELDLSYRLFFLRFNM